MSLHVRDLAHRIAGEELRLEAPEELEAFEIVFDAVYGAVEDDLSHGPQIDLGSPGEGLPFDTSFLEATTIAAVTWIATALVHAVPGCANRHELAAHLEWFLPRLAAARGQRSRVERLTSLLFEALDERAALSWGAEPDTDSSGPAADLQLSIHPLYRQGETFLTYRLQVNAPEDPVAETFAPIQFTCDPLTYFQELFALFDERSGAESTETTTAPSRIGAIGAHLSNAILPPGLAQALSALQGRARTLQVVSEEPWIPWELLRLQNTDGTPGPFLGEAFALAKRLRGLRPVSALPFQNVGLVVPRDSALPNSPAERELVLSLARNFRFRRITEIPANREAMTAAFCSGLYDGWHFVGHGQASGRNPDVWGLRLEAGDTLRAVDLSGEAARLGKEHPLVFLNSCHSGRGALSLTGVGGLARQFLVAGAGAVVGTYWTVTDEAALTFATAFYPPFLAGTAIAEAMRQARRETRERCPGDPSWLAYTLFSHPLASSTSTAEI